MTTKKSKPEVKAVIAFRLKPSIKLALQKQAELDSRSTNSLAEKILTDWLRERRALK
jgi:hypothetical protein